MTALESLQKEYDDLCAQRDATYSKVAPLEAELDAVNAQIEPLAARARELAAQIEAGWGGEAWIELKKKIGATANAIMALKRVRG